MEKRCENCRHNNVRYGILCTYPSNSCIPPYYPVNWEPKEITEFEWKDKSSEDMIMNLENVGKILSKVDKSNKTYMREFGNDTKTN